MSEGKLKTCPACGKVAPIIQFCDVIGDNAEIETCTTCHYTVYHERYIEHLWSLNEPMQFEEPFAYTAWDIVRRAAAAAGTSSDVEIRYLFRNLPVIGQISS